MTRKVCNGCGGYIGVDCFNPQECEWIARSEQANYENAQRERMRRIEDENKTIKERFKTLEAEIERLKSNNT